MKSTLAAGVEPRKKAKQRRSKVRVELILDTTLDMLSVLPADKITTNAIAQNAGVSIGSVYQFFPNKEAIFYELFKRWLAQTIAALDDVKDSLKAGDPVEECVSAILVALGDDTQINSPGRWQLRRAMGSSRSLAELEEKHLREIIQRIVGLQSVFGCKASPGLETELALLQNQVTVACLQMLALTENSPNRARIFNWCKRLLTVSFDFDCLDDVRES
ncbi:MAG: TetR/AcrR family transcriptional regulator [Pseudomonadota bacterium]